MPNGDHSRNPVMRAKAAEAEARRLQSKCGRVVMERDLAISRAETAEARVKELEDGLKQMVEDHHDRLRAKRQKAEGAK